ncbi:MAG: hypothetical protein UY50_C0005G0028 [Parcubacteria group bacterium GW2011_GWA2_49_9]|nr:MAG: hypothetical protein UY50_C0005G0028 [Parcubacteria group bacterium GW2011_GWA2_49_9]
MNPETKKILKRAVDDSQVEKKRIQQEIVTVTKDIGRSEAKKKELENQLALIDVQTVNINKDMDG